MKFSEREGYKPVRDALQVESIDNDLRNRLWNLMYDMFFNEILDQPF